MIFDLPARETTEPYWHKLKWMKIDDRIHYKKAQMIYKALNGLAPPIFKGHVHPHLRYSFEAR